MLLTRLTRNFGRKLTINPQPLNWELARSLVTPRTNPVVNTATATSGGQGQATVIVQEQTEFPKPEHIAIAKQISASGAVFVEEGEAAGISFRVVTGSQELANEARAVIQGDLEFSGRGVTVLLSDTVDLDGNFYYCKERRLAIGNGFAKENAVDIVNDGL